MKLIDERSGIRELTWWGWGLVVLSAVVAIVGLAVGIVYPIENRACDVFSEQIDADSHHYDFFAGCFVTIDGETVPQSAYRWEGNS